MLRQRNIRIIATLGPASSSPEMIRALFEAGADVFRLNLSHLKPADVAAIHATIRAVEEETDHPIGILADLQGPKFRIGAFRSHHAHLKAGATFILDRDTKPGSSVRVCLPHEEIFATLERGADIFLDDGKIRLRATKVLRSRIETEVIQGGILGSRKGVNLPNAALRTELMTDTDHTSLAALLDLGIDWVALSFVQTASDVRKLRKIVGKRAAIIAKIERPEALRNIEDIVLASDAVMVARGDLGVELPVEEVPGAQKHIIDTARQHDRLVVVATQMLESMVSAPVPTRAEVSDVANAIFEGADAVMLSAESAAGDFPVEAVTVMDRVGAEVERDHHYRSYVDSVRDAPAATRATAITAAARHAVEVLDARAIVTYTTSGSTALRAARERPNVAIIALTPRKETARKLTMCWGITTIFSEDATDFPDMVDKACRAVLDAKFAKKDDYIAITAGVPFGVAGQTNVLHLAKL
jgi:pyruvate kinase